MRSFTNAAGSIALAGLTVCAFVVSRLPLEPWPAQAQAQAQSGTPAAKPVAKSVPKSVPKPPKPKDGAPKTGVPTATAKPARPDFTLEDEADAVVLGIADAPTFPAAAQA